MMLTKRLLYRNRTGDDVTIIMEPWAEEYTISPLKEVEIKIFEESPSVGAIEVEHSKEYLLVWIPDGGIFQIFSDGLEMRPFNKKQK